MTKDQGLAVIHKFGGTSVGTPERVRGAVRLIAAERYRQRRGRLVVVSSAFGGVTDRLLEAIRAAVARKETHRTILGEIRERHEAALRDLADPAEHPSLRAHLDALWEQVRELLDGVFLLRECSPRFTDAIISAGERASVPLVAAAFRNAGLPARAFDARTLVRTDDRFGEATVDFATTRALTQAAFADLPPDVVPIVTGFVATTEEGVTTTLGRSGSDYTATILADALDAGRVVIWTDVNGVLSADPRLVPEAFTLDALSYQEAAELAFFGAKVLHPRTMRPLVRRSVPLEIRNTMDAGGAATVISDARTGAEGTVKAVTAIRGAALVTLRGSGASGASALAARAFEALAQAGIDVFLMAQASSEQTVTLAVRGTAAEATQRILVSTLARELERGDLLGVEVEEGAAVVAAVGDFMHYAPGVAGRMFATLGKARINVLAIAQGASDTAISAAVSEADASAAVRALHEAFAMKRTRAHLVLVGAGAVGQRLLALLDAQQEALLDRQVNLQLVGLATSTRAVYEPGGLPFDTAEDALRDDHGLSDVLDEITAARLERLIVVDATASEAVARRYPDLLRAGVGVVTPNKQAGTLDHTFWQDLQAAIRARRAPFLYDTTVGAGLALLSSLREAVRTGDRIRLVEGVFSGTLGYVFNAMRDGTPFSEAVRQAHAAGYTEPDPRDDLTGVDAARKLLILARELGPDAGFGDTVLADVTTTSLVPSDIARLPLDLFWARLPELDAGWERQRQAAGADSVLQYVSTLDVDAGQLQCRVRAVAADSPLARLRGSSLVAVCTTDRYAPEPLIVQGPGANIDITAAVLLADVVRAAEAM
ncbi:MAG: bifunctional aspartate kinase/homoserine dehydrogenase I [Bacteroidota bacterium]